MSTIRGIDRPPETPGCKEYREILLLFTRAKRGGPITDEVERLREYRDRLIRAAEIERARLNP